jgi:hypothetical protein
MKVIVEFCHVAAAVTAGTSTAQEANAATSQGRWRALRGRDVVMSITSRGERDDGAARRPR